MLNSKESLEHICKNCDNECCPYIHYEQSRCSFYGVIKQDLDRLHKLEKENKLLKLDLLEYQAYIKKGVEEHYKDFMSDYDVLLEECNELNKENKKLKKIIKNNFDYFKENKRVFFNYNLPVMEKDILKVLENE